MPNSIGAIIPCGGPGTRLLPATRTVPKELLPVARRPMIDHALREAQEADLEPIAIVGSPDKPLLKKHVEQHRGVLWVEQPTPLGLYDALRIGAEALGPGPWALLLPDGILDPPAQGIRRVLSSHACHGQDTLGVVRLSPAHSGLFGNCGLVELVPDGPDLRIERISEKRTGELVVPDLSTLLKGFPRQVLTSAFFHVATEALATIPDGEELHDVPILRTMARDGLLMGAMLDGEPDDVGNAKGYAHANARLSSW